MTHNCKSSSESPFSKLERIISALLGSSVDCNSSADINNAKAIDMPYFQAALSYMRRSARAYHKFL